MRRQQLSASTVSACASALKFQFPLMSLTFRARTRTRAADTTKRPGATLLHFAHANRRRPANLGWLSFSARPRIPRNDFPRYRGRMMYTAITVSCACLESDDFTDELNPAAIDCETFERRPRAAYAAAGDTLDIAENAAPYPAVIGTFIVWLKARMEPA